MSDVRSICSEVVMLEGEDRRAKVIRLSGEVASGGEAWVTLLKEALVGLLGGNASVGADCIRGTISRDDYYDIFSEDLDLLLDFLMTFGLVSRARFNSVEEGANLDFNQVIDIYDKAGSLVVQVRLDVRG